MPSGFGFVAPPGANPGFFENQPGPVQRVAPSETTAPDRMPTTGVYSSHNSIPIAQPNTNEIGSNTQSALANPPRPVTPVPQPSSAPSHYSVPLTQPSGWPITPSTQQAASKPNAADDEEPKKLLDPIGFVMSDRPSVPVHYEPHRPLIPTSAPGVPLAVKAPQIAMPKIGPTRDTGHSTVPVHEPNLAPIVPTGPEKPIWVEYPGLIQAPQNEETAQQRPIGTPSIPITHPAQRPILRPNEQTKPIWVEYPGLIRGPQNEETVQQRPIGTPSIPITHPAQRPILRPNEQTKPIWMEYRNEPPPQSSEGPVNALAKDMSSVKLHDFYQQPILPPRESLKPIWLEYPSMNQNQAPTAGDKSSSSDQASVPIGHSGSGPVQQPGGLVKPFWVEYPDAGSRPSVLQPSFSSSKDSPSANLDRQDLPIMPRGEPSKPSWSGLLQAKRPPPGLVTSLAKDRPSVMIGPDPPKKMSSEDKKTVQDTWKPVRPVIRGDNPSVPIGPQTTQGEPLTEERPRQLSQPQPKLQRRPEQKEKLEVITLYPEDKEVIKLYREDPSQERELWIHTTDMERARNQEKGPYVTKLVVSDNGKIPLSAVEQPSSCRRSYEQEAGQENSLYRSYASTGDGSAANYVPQCT